MLELVLDNSPDDAGPFVFTVFTPTFNRALTLHRVYQCLEGQTFRDFEWLIVDDGSSDSTGDLVAMWAKTASFPVRYWRQENLGKHVAFNRGVERANGAFFLTLDSDDWCVPEALARLKSHWDSIPEKVRDDFSAVTVLCKTEEGEIVGEPFPNEFVDSNSLEMRYRYKNRAEHWGFHRTDVLRKFQFPEDPTVKFVPESITWRAIARQYQTRYVNDPLRVYTTDGSGRLTHASSRTVAAGKALHYGSILNDDIDWFWRAPLDIGWAAAQFGRFSWHSGAGARAQLRSVNGLRSMALWALMLPFGFLQYRRDCFGHARAAKISAAATS